MYRWLYFQPCLNISKLNTENGDVRKQNGDGYSNTILLFGYS